jgi:transcriptional regulator with XRE-family HTH domain/quercetin dioxygenase-like cupin family protein
LTDSAPSRGIGSRIRRIRTDRGLSVRELARRAGCSASLVSQVERGVTAPSAGVAYALANELGISLDSLFGAGDTPSRPVARSWGRADGPDGAGLVQRAGDRHRIELSTGVRWDRLTPMHDDTVDFIEVVYAAGGRSSDDGRAIRHDGREYLYVVQGELEAVIGFETLHLSEGDSLAFDPETPHHYRNPTSDTVRVLSVVVHDAR